MAIVAIGPFACTVSVAPGVTGVRVTEIPGRAARAPFWRKKITADYRFAR